MLSAETVQPKPLPYRRALYVAAALNLLMMAGEVVGALLFNSISLFADAIDFYEDAMTYLMAAALIGVSARPRALFGGGIALFMAILSVWIGWKSVQQMLEGLPPDPIPMGLIGLVGLAVNVYCAFILLPHRRGDSAHLSVWLSTRNDAIAGVAIVGAAAVTLFWPSVWPDAVVGLAIALLNLHAAVLIIWTSWREWRGAAAPT